MAEKILKTIQEHNDERLDAARAKEWTGVACPECSSEMRWSGGGIQLTSPPKRWAVCSECNHRTKLIA
jgi:DNA-directed RNA polymerase subunit RPC12/RpoP